MESQITAAIPKARVHSPGAHPVHAPGEGLHDGNGHEAADHDQIDLNVPMPKSRWIITVCILGVLVLLVLLTVGLWPRVTTAKQLAADAYATLHAPVPVNVITAHRADRTMDVVLPGDLHPWQEVSLYARTTGYLVNYNVDISDHVYAGDVMAVVDSPDVDQQLIAARNALQQAKDTANRALTARDFAKRTWDRYEKLRGGNGVTEQQLDQAQDTYETAVHTYNTDVDAIGVAQANVEQLVKMQSYEKVIAPFSGVVTARAYYKGAMILANPTTPDQLPIFKIADNTAIRCFIKVPQNYALTIKQGMKVNITARERPGQVYVGEVLGTTNYLDLSARTLLTEVRIENPDPNPAWRRLLMFGATIPDHTLLPGMAVDATVKVTRDTPPLVIPASALVITAEGNQVAIVTKEGKVHFQPVKLGVDFGNEIEITGGLSGDEQIIENPGERTTEDAVVAIAGEQKPATRDGTAKEKVAEAGK